MKYRIVHETRYAYTEPVLQCHNEARLRPRSTAHQRCLASDVSVSPPPAALAPRSDIFGNPVLYFAVQQAHDQLVVRAASEVEITTPGGQPLLAASAPWEAALERLNSDAGAETREARQFLLDSAFAAGDQLVADYARQSFAPGRPLLEAVRDLSRRIHCDFTFDTESTTVATPVAEVFARRSGVCQDFAHLAIACLRALGVAARYVSGYLETVPPPGQPRLTGADASHAWFAVYAPGSGWVDFDPTNDQMPGDRYVTTAWGRDYGDVAPLKGVIFGGGAHSLTVAVDMLRLDAPPT
jgi:transglutaminase-like putative cysteine protease